MSIQFLTRLSECQASRVTLRLAWFVQLHKNKIQGLVKDEKEFSRTKFESKNQNSLSTFFKDSVYQRHSYLFSYIIFESL